MKTAIEKPVTPGGVFDHLMVPQGDEPEFHPSKDPKTMTMQEFLEEVDRFLCWNRMTPEEKRAEQEAQRAASHATEQAAGDIPCTMRPERVPDTPQDTVWEDLTDAPQDVVRADVLTPQWTVCWRLCRATVHQKELQTRCQTMSRTPQREMCQGGKQILCRMAHRTISQTL